MSLCCLSLQFSCCMILCLYCCLQRRAPLQHHLTTLQLGHTRLLATSLSLSLSLSRARALSPLFLLLLPYEQMNSQSSYMARQQHGDERLRANPCEGAGWTLVRGVEHTEASAKHVTQGLTGTIMVRDRVGVGDAHAPADGQEAVRHLVELKLPKSPVLALKLVVRDADSPNRNAVLNEFEALALPGSRSLPPPWPSLPVSQGPAAPSPAPPDVTEVCAWVVNMSTYVWKCVGV